MQLANKRKAFRRLQLSWLQESRKLRGDFFFEVPANTKYSYRTAGMDWFLIPGCIPTSRPPFLGRTLDTVRLWPGWISYWRPMNDLCRWATDRNLNRFQHDLWVVLWALFIVIYIIDVWLFKCKWNSFIWWIKCCAQLHALWPDKRLILQTCQTSDE